MPKRSASVSVVDKVEEDDSKKCTLGFDTMKDAATEKSIKVSTFLFYFHLCYNRVSLSYARYENYI